MIRESGLGNKLSGLKAILPELILEDHFKMRPDMARQYTEHQKAHFQNDIRWILSFMAESAWADKPELFDEFSSWLRTFLTSVNVPMKDVAESYRLLQERILKSCTGEEGDIVRNMINSGLRILLSDSVKISLPATENKLSVMARDYLDSILAGDKSQAIAKVVNRVKEGASVRDIYIEIFQPVQYEIGRLWQTNKISVAQEHFCTAATQLAMSQLYPYLFTGNKKTYSLVTTCVPGELHEMGPRMLTDFFEMEGWDTYYLGANMPADGLISFLSEKKPHVLAISATMTYHLKLADDMIRKVRADKSVNKDLKIIVGGYPFRVADGLWKDIGADGYADSARQAITLVNNLIVN